MAEYQAANGQIFTDEQIDQWCVFYDKGMFPPGEKSVRYVRNLPGSEEVITTMTLKIPASLKEAIRKKSAESGMTLSDGVRSACTDWVTQTV